MNQDKTKGEVACENLHVSLKEFFESKLTEVERRLISLNDLHRYMAGERQNFATRELHDKLEAEVVALAKAIVALNTKISTWFLIVAGAYGLIQIGLSALFYHLFTK